MTTKPLRSTILGFSCVAICLGLCPNIPFNDGRTGWPKNTAVTVYIDASLSSQRAAISNAFANWSNKAGTGVTFTVSASAPPTGAQPNNTWIVSGIGGTAALTSWPPGTITLATTTYPTSVPPEVAVQLMAHEIGHTFYMGDCNTPADASCVNQTVMEKPSTPSSATSPTSDCDVNAIWVNSGGNTGAYGTGSSGGGGGGDGGGTVCNNPCGSTCLDGAVCDYGSAYCDSTSGGLVPACPTCPIIVDAFGEGFHLTGLPEGVQFRVLPTNNTPSRMSWTDSRWRNGWLALDRNGNGKIDDFTELFGEFTPQPAGGVANGYAALAVFDDRSNGGNGNGRIDPEDSVFSRLVLWIDANHDGVSQPDEMYALKDLGIFEIGLTYAPSAYVDEFGNAFRFKSQIWDEARANESVCYDVYLQVEAHVKQSGQR
jgi:hypothetical protein